MKMTVFWVVAPCRLVQALSDTIIISLMMEAASTSGTSRKLPG
jgi:hypothetical protein